MQKTAFLFPGQGSQYVGMAKDLFEKSDEVKALFDLADETLGINLSEIMFNGPLEALKQTDVTQPAIFLHSVALLKLINTVKPEATAGHSLGEYSANVCANSIDFTDALKLVHARGEAMLQASVHEPGTMAAIVGLHDAIVEEVCQTASNSGIVQCANFNSPGQVVISGSVNGVHEAMKIAKAKAAKLVKELAVSGAFHSPLMQSAREKLNVKLNETKIINARIPVYTNVNATPVVEAGEIKKMLLDQLTSPVRWEEIIKNMISDGVDNFIEIGPGKVLQGLVKRINPNVNVFGIDTYSDAERFF